MELKEIIRSLVQQCNIESISTKDLAKELTTLYTRIESSERTLEYRDATIKELTEELAMTKKTLATYKQTHVEPVEKIKLDRSKLDKATFEFSVEKKFADRENTILRELLKSLTVSRSTNESYYGGGNGASWNKNEAIDKPPLPGTPFSAGI